jgi:hypothetical protein
MAGPTEVASRHRTGRLLTANSTRERLPNQPRRGTPFDGRFGRALDKRVSPEFGEPS